MQLEEAIKQQKKFNSEFEKLYVNLIYTSGILESGSIQRFKQFGISPQQYNVLRILRGSGAKPLMLGDIASRMIDKNSNTTRLVEKLRLKGYVRREICSNNRRQVDILITKKGQDLLADMEKDLNSWFNSLQTLTQGEAATINQLLDKLRG